MSDGTTSDGAASDGTTSASTTAGRSAIVETVTHPVRLRIIQQIGGRNLTTVELREALPEVTQATLYRHVSALLEAGMLAVVEERKVRGAVERTLALGEQMAHVDQEGLRAMSDAQLRSAFLVFLGQLAGDLDRVIDSDDADLRELLGFGRGAVYADVEDLAAIQAGLEKLLAPYRQDHGEQKPRLGLATVLLPDIGS
ncbi:helix-turn-helix domain-containing protein [Brachybacterium sacelli]|uniref:DNA-binding transcriptional ArsR family regulator n=2 Tax=Brachybacterium sacelli TaxID=173364 RepID=A0ABS4X0F9_9MICO|nr:helix-turn-helix domain-containing protein [Brachybacterium sacelli]MBP2381713.1 DNA-binding transcriptional ArsR family regulator [Brachybacterium sacelli]